MRKKTIELTVMLALALIALGDGVRIVRGTGDYRGGVTGGFQVLVAILLIFFALLYWARAERIVVQWGTVTRDPEVRRAFIGLVLFVAYIVALPMLGYMLSSILAFIVYLRVYSAYRWAPLIGGSVVLGVCTAYLWARLDVGLPQGFVAWP